MSGLCCLCGGCGEGITILNPDWPAGEDPYMEKNGEPCDHCGGSGKEPA